MKGNNTMVLNPATVIQALQMWLDAKVPVDPPEVVSVEQLSTQGYQGGMFEVKLSERTKTTA